MAVISGTNGLIQAYDYQVLTTAFSYTFASGVQVLVISPGDALATGTITMPASPADGMTITIITTKTINALTISANAGQSIIGGGAQSLGNNQSVSFMYRSSGTTWLPYAGGLPRATASDIAGVNTTGTCSASSTALTVASSSGISEGDLIVGEGITPGTYVETLSGTSVTMSTALSASTTTFSADPVTFYSTGKAVTPAAVGGMLCRAWVNLNGTTTPASIRASYNVSSITDSGVGDYTVNFTTAMPDANYVMTATPNDASGVNGFINYATTSPTTSAVRIVFIRRPDGAGADPSIAAIAIFR